MTRARFLFAALPLVVGLALALLFYFQLGRDPTVLPSALIGKPVPEFALPGLAPGQPGFSSADLRQGRPVLVNVFASWCAACVIEHPVLTELVKDPAVILYGLAWRDRPEATARFLAEHGNPYRAVGSDPQNRVGIDWGVYGAPETYVVRGDGTILYKWVGALTPAIIQAEILPRLKGPATP